ncbi:MAG: creatininase family protein [Chloroflexota bacterium]
MKDVWNTSTELRDERPEIAVFGIGAIEQHGAHLPVGTDWLAATAISRQVATELDAYWLPTVPVSMSQCHGPTAGTVWLRPDTLARVVRDLVGSLHGQGFRKIVVLNGHGGNFVLEPTIQELNLTNPSLAVVMPPAFFPRADGEPPIFESTDPEVHAGESETSTHLYLNPELVKEERADGVPSVGREFLDYAFMSQVSPTGVWGHASLATAEKGRRATTRHVVNIVRWVREAFAALGDPASPPRPLATSGRDGEPGGAPSAPVPSSPLAISDRAC